MSVSWGNGYWLVGHRRPHSSMLFSRLNLINLIHSDCKQTSPQTSITVAGQFLRRDGMCAIIVVYIPTPWAFNGFIFGIAPHNLPSRTLCAIRCSLLHSILRCDRLIDGEHNIYIRNVILGLRCTSLRHMFYLPDSDNGFHSTVFWLNEALWTFFSSARGKHVI